MMNSNIFKRAIRIMIRIVVSLVLLPVLLIVGPLFLTVILTFGIYDWACEDTYAMSPQDVKDNIVGVMVAYYKWLTK